VHNKTFTDIGKSALLLSSIIAVAFQCACTPVGTAIGAGARAGIALAEDRSINEVLSDTALRVAINAQLFEASFQDLFWSVTTTVFEGRVLLTGRVVTENLRDEAAQIVWKIEGVREVLNEIEIGENKDVADSARDKMITVSLRTKILRDPQIAGINYKIGAYDRALYLIGVAQNQDELDRVITHAREVGYVRKLVSYVLLSEDPSRLR
jgi:osmotically-inducible protein OsmY